MTTGYDALGHPSPAAVGAGHFVCQYLKNLTSADVAAYHKANVTLVLIFETTGQRSLGGEAAGVADGHSALALANALGAPASAAIYFAEDDFDVSAAQAPTVVAYVKGAQSVLGTRTGFYGGLRAVTAVANAGAATYLWQTYAWSGGKWDPRVSLEQYLNGQTLAGTGVDYDKALKAFGGWGPVAPPPPPAPKPGVPQVHLHRVDYAALNDPQGSAPRVGYYPNDVRPICAALVAKGLLNVRYVANGSFGPPVRKAYAAWEKACGVPGAPSGVPGPGTLGKLGETPGHQFQVLP